MMKNAFHFILKAIFVLKTWLFDHVEKRLDYKDQVNFKIHDVTTWLQTIVIHILLHISRRQSDNEIWSVNRIKHEKHSQHS